MITSLILTIDTEADYELLDSGEGEKLERFGSVTLSRPDPQALWPRTLTGQEWKKSDGYFTREEKKGDWVLGKNVPERWQISFGGLKLWVRPTAFKHVGLFPEQAANWDWLRQKTKPGMEVLNVFAYTGGATLACAQAGAKVTHVDSSKTAVNWARDNAELSGLADKPIRWILDDAATFVKRELKRERKYQCIIIDPPSFGHGPEGELWKIEEHFVAFLEDCKKLLADDASFFLINGYSAGYSAIAYKNNLHDLQQRFGGSIEMGELTIPEKSTNGERLLPCGIFARWAK